MTSKEERKHLLIEMMKEDEKNGMYEVPSKTDNELIAEFMGIDFTAKDAYLTYPPPICKRFGQYDRSWDWLIPVVEKIYDLYNNSDHNRDWCEYSFRLRNALASADKVRVYTAVVNFIKWFNSQQHERKSISGQGKAS